MSVTLKNKSSKKYKLVFTVVVITLAGVLWRLNNAQSLVQSDADIPASRPDSRTAAIKVIAQPVVMIRNDREFEAIGTGRARLSIQIFPAVSEDITGILFEPQQSVAKGELLVQLDDRAEKLAVHLAEVHMKDVRSLLDRYENSVNKGSVPQSELDATRANFESAQIALEQARIDLEDRQIKAPFDGVVGIPNVDPGERVNPDTLITGLDNRKVLYVDYDIPEALAGSLFSGNVNQAVTVTTPAWPERTFSGAITTFGSRVDPDHRTILVRASIDNSEDLLRPGMSFSTRWAIPGADYPAIPEISLQWDRDGSYIWVVRDGTAKKTPVRVIDRTSGQLLVSGNISEGDEVVVEGVQRLQEGTPVDILGGQ